MAGGRLDCHCGGGAWDGRGSGRPYGPRTGGTPGDDCRRSTSRSRKHGSLGSSGERKELSRRLTSFAKRNAPLSPETKQCTRTPGLLGRARLPSVALPPCRTRKDRPSANCGESGQECSGYSKRPNGRRSELERTFEPKGGSPRVSAL